ncbi:Ubiquitin carboxyl-terminal hydrolase [Heracleum sosnowskyi]|uniref:Ubiquitin carboxyl-terminal hydrolase n=1 Tax=Heracleum sosnowskyi TaxID=360622 RepID=A0AAD8JJ56_9APIA|nr:Ubiquitin carboxyl-terminal hydrolase [Heracleum sosnowskyi]
MNHRLNHFFKTLILSLFYSLSLLKSLLSKTLIQSFSLHSMLFDYDNENDDVWGAPLSLPFTPPNDDPQLYLVHDRWWNEAREVVLSGGDNVGVSYLTTSTFVKVDDFWEVDEYSSEILMKMTPEEMEVVEEGVACEYALISDWMFLRALKWHNDVNKVGTIFFAEDTMQDSFSLKIRYFLGKMNILVAKISRKDNEAVTFQRACNIFCVDDGQFRIWDYSGQITQFSLNGRNIPDSVLQNEGILLELQLYGLSQMTKGRHHVKDEMAVDQFNGEEFFWTGSPTMNGITDISSNMRADYQQSASLYREARAMGMTGLLNLGNTCFMNSAFQCLVHTTKFVDYFLGDFKKDLNFENPLGMNGKLALASGDLFRKLWTPGARPVAPTTFKSALSDFAPQFGGYNQHDAQEFLAFLLDGLHEDLNRVKRKPYIEVKDADDIADNEVADEHWRNHLARNDSIIVDVCQGQFRSKLVCPICKKVSTTFDPFMYLSLPLPSTTMRTMTLTVLSTDGSSMPIPVTVTVPKFGKCEDLVRAVSVSCSLRDDETLLLAEVYGSQIMHFLDKPSDSIDLLRDSDQLVAYRLPKENSDSSYLVVFMHQYEYLPMSLYGKWKKFGIPLLARMPDISEGFEIREQFLKLLDPFLLSVEDMFVEDDDVQTTGSEDFKMNAGSTVTLNGYANSELEDSGVNIVVDALNVEDDFQFSLIEENNSLLVR